MKISKMFLKVKYCDLNKESNLILQMALIIHVNYHKDVKICQKATAAIVTQ
jgi:hypothetical protein